MYSDGKMEGKKYNKSSIILFYTIFFQSLKYFTKFIE